jgi:quercetin dioxygenase-like cupin family protein
MLKQIAIVVALVALSTPGASAQQGQTTKQLLDTSTTVAGTSLKYPSGTPKFAAVLSTLEPGGTTPRHMHPVPTFIYVVEGTLAVDVDGGVTREVKAGEAFMEVVDTWHRNRNPSSTTRVQYLLVFAADDKTPYVIRAK